MTYTVVWIPKAQDDLTAIWLNAADRATISKAANSLDRELTQNPAAVGESRPADAESRIACRWESDFASWRMTASSGCLPCGDACPFAPNLATLDAGCAQRVTSLESSAGERPDLPGRQEPLANLSLSLSPSPASSAAFREGGHYSDNSLLRFSLIHNSSPLLP